MYYHNRIYTYVVYGAVSDINAFYVLLNELSSEIFPTKSAVFSACNGESTSLQIYVGDGLRNTPYKTRSV